MGRDRVKRGEVKGGTTSYLVGRELHQSTTKITKCQTERMQQFI